jgi:hypothetical protein
MQFLNVYYDMRIGPVTFDYANFLICAEGYRQSTGLQAIRLNLVAPGFRKMSPRDVALDDAEKLWRLNHILMRLPSLLPSVSRISLQYDIPETINYPIYPIHYVPMGQGQAVKPPPYLGVHVNEFHAAGRDVQPFRATDRARKLVGDITQGRRYLTISLRTSAFQPERNANLDEWFKVYAALTGRGFDVYVIPDFEDALTVRAACKFDWKIADFATYELDLRMALYERAVDNLCVNNGIATLLWYSKAPLKMFKMLTGGVGTTTPEFIKDAWGVEFGESPKFLQSHQKWVWLDDNAENILGGLSL